jgi:hypothetical protein
MFPQTIVAKLPFGVIFAHIHPSINNRVRVMVKKTKRTISRQGAGFSMIDTVIE